MTIGGSLALIAAGAVLRWAVTAHINGFNLQTAGLVLLHRRHHRTAVLAALHVRLGVLAPAGLRRPGRCPVARPPTYYR